MGNERICGERAPEALTGNLGVFKCTRAVTRDGSHAGEHKAHKTIPGVGRINVQWKQSQHAGRQRVYRPEVTLPKAEATHLIGVVESGGRFTRHKIRCACPDWKIGIGHIPPCPLVGQ